MSDPSQTGRRWIACGALLAALAVVLGAFAAHGLDAWLVDQFPGETRQIAGAEFPRAYKLITDFRTGAEYQMTHAIGLIAVGISMFRAPQARGLRVAAWSFVIGILLFSGSLYGIALTGMSALGAIAPLGGTAFIVGWVAFAMAMFRSGDEFSAA
ncbi:MAG: DUF423 domain-containing protein [Planctomycetaceae bacterium]